MKLSPFGRIYLPPFGGICNAVVEYCEFVIRMKNVNLSEILIRKTNNRMSTGYKIADQSQLYYVTLRVVYWVDIFTRQVYRDIIIKSLHYCQLHKQLEIYAYVIMSNHIHLLVRSGNNDLSGTLRDFKKYTSKAIIKEIQDNVQESRKNWLLFLFSNAAKRQNKSGEYQFWTHDNHAELICSEKFIRQKITYIHNNPIRAGIVEQPEEYLYSSARDYAGNQSPIKIIQLDI